MTNLYWLQHLVKNDYSHILNYTSNSTLLLFIAGLSITMSGLDNFLSNLIDKCIIRETEHQ